MKGIKGITLIALVITIVVLIILAGVAISLSLGENGIFKKAKYATEEYANEQAKEEKDINDLYGEILVATDGTVTIDATTLNNLIKKEVDSKFKVKTITYDDITIASGQSASIEFTIDEGYELVSITPRFGGTGSSYIIANIWSDDANTIGFRNTRTISSTITNLTVTILEKKIEE